MRTIAHAYLWPDQVSGWKLRLVFKAQDGTNERPVERTYATLGHALEAIKDAVPEAHRV